LFPDQVKVCINPVSFKLVTSDKYNGNFFGIGSYIFNSEGIQSTGSIIAVINHFIIFPIYLNYIWCFNVFISMISSQLNKVSIRRITALYHILCFCTHIFFLLPIYSYSIINLFSKEFSVLPIPRLLSMK